MLSRLSRDIAHDEPLWRVVKSEDVKESKTDPKIVVYKPSIFIPPLEAGLSVNRQRFCDLEKLLELALHVCNGKTLHGHLEFTPIYVKKALEQAKESQAIASQMQGYKSPLLVDIEIQSSPYFLRQRDPNWPDEIPLQVGIGYNWAHADLLFDPQKRKPDSYSGLTPEEVNVTYRDFAYKLLPMTLKKPHAA